MFNKIYYSLLIPTALKNISKKLDCKIIKKERVEKIYGSKINNFIITTSQNKKYFLKFQNKKDTSDEIAGYRLLENKLPRANIILSSIKNNWILFEYINGQLMAEKFLEFFNNVDSAEFEKIELKKENLLKKIHNLYRKTIDIKSFVKNRTNRLFYKRLFGNRYKEYYGTKGIRDYFKYNLIINGVDYKISLEKILNNIKNKYKNTTKKTIDCILGHGDAHHGNILLNEKIYFIDTEYSGFITPYMEMSKPYYNDFIGILFFHHQNILRDYFIIKDYFIAGNDLIINAAYKKQIDLNLKITKIKINTRKETCNHDQDDILSLNDYLILCHMFTKNPNYYDTNTQKLFVLFCLILYEFDPFKPETIYNFLTPLH